MLEQLESNQLIGLPCTLLGGYAPIPRIESAASLPNERQPVAPLMNGIPYDLLGQYDCYGWIART